MKLKRKHNKQEDSDKVKNVRTSYIPKFLGRTPLYTDPLQIISIAKSYFEYRRRNKLPYTITGLSLALGMERVTFIDYCNNKNDEITKAARWAKGICEDFAEQRSFAPNNAGAQFILRAGFGWKDQVADVNLFTPGAININDTQTILQNLYTPLRSLPTAPVKYTASLRPGQSYQGDNDIDYT